MRRSTVKLDLYRDGEGLPRAAGDDLLSRFLESDVQGSVITAYDILGMLDRVESGETELWEGTGNAYTLTLTPDGALIQDELAEDPEELHLPLAELREALQAWIALLLDSHQA
ncbi:MAG TPA: hypothetical protein VH394_18740 [Thermoanaerobaculia bacterium]|jgi:hypothetical protein|nr:hypothetical protein [Thermoanaerobaculia bacterium]